MRDAWNVARGVWWRQAHLFFTNPSFLLPSLLFPLFFFTAFVGGLSRISEIPGFDFPLGYTAFQFVFVLLQSAAFSGVFTGFGIARDIQTGFLNRLALTPVRGIVLLFGQLGGLLAIALVQAVFYLVVGVAFGVRLETGFGGAALLLVLKAVIALAFASFGCWAALRTGSTEAVQGLFPVFFVFLFLSSMNIPRNLIETTWFRWVTTINPVSYLIEAVRALVIYDWRWETVGLGFAVAGVMSVIGFALATHALIRRMERT